MRVAKMKLDSRNRVQIPSNLAIANDWRPGDYLVLRTAKNNIDLVLHHEKKDRQGKFENKPLYGVEKD